MKKLNQNLNGFAPIFILITVLIIGGLVAGAYYFSKSGMSKTAPNEQSSTVQTPNTSSTTNWLIYNSPSGDFSFKYPPEIRVNKDNLVNPSFYFSSKDSSNNQAYFMVEKVTSNIYNQPFDKFVKVYASDASKVEKVLIGGLSAQRLKDRFGKNSEQVFIQSGDDIYEIRFYNYGDTQHNTEVFTSILQTFTFKPSVKNSSEVKVVDGDIVIVKNGNETKITQWGYNSSPVLSPDKTKIAYISQSKESLENEKVDQGYKRTSTNIWVINNDGSNPIQITNHINFVYRSNPHWLDNNKLLFVDGEQSVKVYTISTKALQTVMGPEKAVQACLDACGFETRYYYSPDFSYLIRLTGGGGGVAIPAKTAILNTQTLQTNEVKEEFGINFDTISFPNNTTLTFKGSELPNYEKQVQVSINLSTQQVSIH